MSETINQRIIKKINEMDCSDEIKQFLKEILLFELEFFEGRVTRYSEEYTRALKKYAANYKGV
jgi:methyl coenzyme M reductase subunit D